MDAFNVAFRVPNLVRDLFAEGAMTAAFVPTFTRTLQARGREAAWRLGNLVINALLVVTGVLVVLGIVFAAPITELSPPAHRRDALRFSDSARRRLRPRVRVGPGKLELTTQLTRIMMPFLTTVAVAVAVMGMLNALHRFFLPALSPAMFNVVTILGAFLLVPLMPPFGLPPNRRHRDRDRARRHRPDRRPVAGPAQGRLPLPADPQLPRPRRARDPAPHGPGHARPRRPSRSTCSSTRRSPRPSRRARCRGCSIAFRLMYLPIGLFGVSIATAALPDLSRHAAADDRDAMRRTISTGLRMMLMLNVPATIGLIVLAQPIVELLLEYATLHSSTTPPRPRRH